MKAVRIQEFGPPGVIRIDDLPRPEPGPGELLIRVSAAGWATGMPSSARAKFRANPCHSFSAPNFQESSKQSVRERLASKRATKCTGQRTSDLRGDTRNTPCHQPNVWLKNRRT